MFHPLAGSALADGKLGELAKQLGRKVEHHKSKSTQPNHPRKCPSLYTVQGDKSTWGHRFCYLEDEILRRRARQVETLYMYKTQLSF